MGRGGGGIFVLFNSSKCLGGLCSSGVSGTTTSDSSIFGFRRFRTSSSLRRICRTMLRFPILDSGGYIVLHSFSFLAYPTDSLRGLFILVDRIPSAAIFVL